MSYETSQSAVLNETQLQQLRTFAQSLTPIQRAWASGYLAAKLESEFDVASNILSQNQSQTQLTILYGSQTGNGRSLAVAVSEQARQQGIAVNLCSMAEYSERKLKKESHLLLVVSTHGEGDPPDDALALYQYLHSDRAPKLKQLKFSVLALGDSSYEFFCQTGKDFSTRLSALGAQAITPELALVACDLDFELDAAHWQQAVLAQLKAMQPGTAAMEPSTQAPIEADSPYSRSNPFVASVLSASRITSRDSIKEVVHLELDLTDSGIRYQPGDSLGVWAENSPELVAAILTGLSLSAAEYRAQSLLTLLQHEYELTRLHPALIEAWASWSNHQELLALGDKKQMNQFIQQHQLLDLVLGYPVQITAEQLVDKLRKLTPRLYSIASSQAEVEDEVHLCVALVHDQTADGDRYGCASLALTRSLQAGDRVKVYPVANSKFRLPADPNEKVIMVGPGTGVAPFRAFMQQRAAQGHSGGSWLFFGNPNQREDFLYQTEWQKWLQHGVLERISLAFSRDQDHKIYVQDRIKQAQTQLWQWLQQGAFFYVCGDAKGMGPAVEQALLDTAIAQGGLSPSASNQWLQGLKQSGRYQKDLY